MFLRSSYATGDPAGLTATLDALKREAVPALASEPGYRGYSLFADRELGKIAMGSWWEDEEAEAKSNVHLEAKRLELLSGFAAGVSTEIWEAAVFRPPQAPPPAGAWFRLIRTDFPPFEADSLTSMFEERAVPGLEAIPGLLGCSLLVEREAGHASVGTMWVDRAALAASRGPHAAMRRRALSGTGVVVRSLEEFEVVLVHRP